MVHEYRGISHEALVFFKGWCVYPENTSVKCDITWYITGERCITILYHTIENTVANTINATNAHDGKVGYNTMEYSTAFLCSDWRIFQWYGIAGLCAYTELACAVCSCPYST